MYKKIIEKLKDKNVAILGFGKEGISTYKFIRRHLNQKLTIIDKNEKIKENEILLNDNNIEFVVGDNYLDNLDKYDIIIKSAGVSLKDIDDSKIIDKLTSQYALILEDTDLFTIGITASKGKTTTTTLTYEVIKNQKDNVYLLGNMGNPPLDQIETFDKDSILVIELAALQLQYVRKSPKISCLLNLFEEHLDYFGEKEKYYEAKLNIFKHQENNDYSLYFKDNETLNNYVKNMNFNSNLITISMKDKEDVYLIDNKIYINDEIVYIDTNERHILGTHNLQNIMFTLYICKILNLDLNKAIKVINEFNPLEHRMEFVGTFNDIKFYNDSIATIPEATINCIDALKDVDTLIFGGMDRGIDYNSFIDYLNNSNINNFICMPDTGYKIGKVLNKNVYFIDDLKEAVDKAYEVTKKGSSCLLSPAASSYNKYKNFEEKGRLYKEYIKNY